jgi:hypothetical protein
MKNCGTANKTYTHKTYPTASIQLDAGMYSRQQLQVAIEWIDAINAKAKALDALNAQAAMQPKKEWVGLTKEEVVSILEDAAIDDRGYVVAMVEAALKEKNA